jgi:predicted Zn-dependent protease
MMKHGLKTTLFVSLVLFVFSSCSKNSLSGKSQLSFLPEKEIQSMSADQYKDFLQKHVVLSPAKDPNAAMVQRVSLKITKAVEKYFKDKNKASVLNGFNWEYNTVKDSAINAWCMPGGKVAVYTGILPITKDDVGLATVMGHEISHAIARHSAERYSQTLAAQAGGNILGAITGNQSQTTQQAIGKLYGIGGSLALLKYSRNQESEADHLGLLFMAMAGYNPEKAVDFWERMATSKGANGAPPEFLSTHPSDATRIADIKKSLPEALTYYQAAKR